MIRRSCIAVSGALLLGGAFGSGCVGLRFDREAMLGNIADTMITPAHLGLIAETEELDALARQFASSPAPEALDALRAQWLRTAVAWKGVELYEFPGLLLIHNAIERRPARIRFIEEAVAGADEDALEAVNAAFVESLGSTTKGLAAIEYLIFPSEGDEVPSDRFGDPTRRAFLTALTGNLRDKAGELYLFWAPEAGNYVRSFRQNDSEGADIQGSISLLANEMIELLEMVMRTRLGMPMGETTDGVPRPEEVESYLSGASLALMAASIESVQRAFEGGFDDYLDYLDRSPPEEDLASAIRAQLEVVLDALAEIPPPLSRAVTGSPAEIELAFESMRELLVLVKTDMAALLGITVTFSDNDGD